ncbi:Scr1 family TA system antitoxin-like transcriptional regulator [Streptomyces fagopyri]|uniref:Scr1 family TA system antitoxin-like transcriptional regulator n=1 Tax=Streptomyces fagopyri TaxID=2662397 RepID=UPI00370FBEAC
MPPRPNPTARQGRLGAELRKLRESAGVVSRDVAAWLGTNQAQISNIEAGKHGISEERLRKLAEYYACDDTRLVESLVAMANDRARGWWEEYRGVLPARALDLPELEHHSARIRTFQFAHIPGLLQTEDHIRAASLFVQPQLPESDRADLTAFRLRRQQVLGTGRAYEAIIHEAALRMRVGGPEVARAQLERVLSESERESVTVKVIPFTADGFAGAGQSVLYIAGPVPQLDTAQVDTGNGSLFVDASARLHRYRTRLERIDSAALAPGPSRDLIRSISQEL